MVDRYTPGFQKGSQYVHVISMWFNEDYLEPLFYNHYARVDRFTIINDTGPVLDDVEKARRLSIVANESDADIRIVVDADEFVYCVQEQEIVEPGKVYVVDFWEVFRHRTDDDIDRQKPPLQQRCFGNPDIGESFGQKGMFRKPIVFGKGVEVKLAPGNHYQDGGEIVCGMYHGAHWAMADPEIAVPRRMMKRSRMGGVNYRNGLTSHDWNVTEQAVRDECSKRLNSPWVVSTGRERY